MPTFPSRPIAGALMLAAAISLAGCDTHSKPAASPSPSVAGTDVLVFDCQTPKYEPTAFTIACADGNLRVQGATWSSWTAQGALGKGTIVENTCTPSCVAGKFVNEAATLALSGAVPYDGKQVFASLKATLPNGTVQTYGLVTTPL